MPPNLCFLSYGEEGGLQTCSPPAPWMCIWLFTYFYVFLCMSLEPEVNEGSERTD